MRFRSIAAFVGILTLEACVGADAPPPSPVDTRMPVVIDYYNRRTLHQPIPPPAPTPADQEPGRERNFGPETRRTEPASNRLVAALDAFRHAEPAAGRTLLALAKSHKTKPSMTARGEDWLGATDEPTSRAPEPERSGPEPHGVDDADGGYRLNFEDAEIKDVMQAVLGKVLGLNYTIAPNVTGHITISSSAPQSRAELLSTIETVLALQGLSLTKTGNTYRIAPLAVGAGTLDKSGTEAGFGISVVPVQYTSVASMTKLLSGFVVEADGIRVDTAHNAVIIRGPAPRREEIVRAIKAFDGDWMHQQSVSVFELRHSRPDEVIGELNRIFDADQAGESAGVVQFKAIRRLRSIMVISKNDTLIRRAGSWIHRLDHQDTSATDSIFVYRPRYRDAKELSKLVNGLFGQGQQGADSGSVSFQQNGQQDASGQNGGQTRTIGTSTAAFAGGLNAPTQTSQFGGGQGGGFGTNAGQGAGQGTGQGAQAAGGGLQGSLADPIEAGQSQGQGRGHLSLSADVSNNTIVAYTDGETYAKVSSVLRQLDVPPLQVAINVIIAEVQLNDELKYGVQFYLNAHKSIGSVGLVDTATNAITSKLPGFNFLLGSNTTPDVLINALDSISKVHILSSPSIVVTENRPATFEVGNQVPVVTQTAQSNISADAPTVNSVQYLDTGIILKIIPRIGQNGDVAMDLDQVISAVVPDATGSTSASLTPTISKRRIASAISVKSGQSVLLAGLINDTRSQSKGQVPFLGPGLGDLLGNRDNAFTRSELVVFIRPVIVRDADDAASVAEDFRSRLRAMNLHPAPVYKP